jgi:hypothetical protein
MAARPLIQQLIAISPFEKSRRMIKRLGSSTMFEIERRTRTRRQTGPARPQTIFKGHVTVCQALFLGPPFERVRLESPVDIAYTI